MACLILLRGLNGVTGRHLVLSIAASCGWCFSNFKITSKIKLINFNLINTMISLIINKINFIFKASVTSSRAPCSCHTKLPAAFPVRLGFHSSASVHMLLSVPGTPHPTPAAPSSSRTPCLPAIFEGSPQAWSSVRCFPQMPPSTFSPQASPSSLLSVSLFHNSSVPCTSFCYSFTYSFVNSFM